MAITFDAGSGQTGYDNATTGGVLTFSATCAGADRYLVVGLAAWRGGVLGVTSVTYDGVAMTQLAFIQQSVSDDILALYGLAAPNIGSHNVVITISETLGVYVAGGASCYNGVHQTVSTGTSATAEGNSTTPSVDVSSASGELVVDCVLAVNLTTAGGGQTERYNTLAAVMTTKSSDEAGAGTTTMSWTSNTSQWSIAGVPLKPSSEVDPTIFFNRRYRFV